MRGVGLGLLSVALPLVLLTPVPAHAERVVTEDAAGDAEAWTDFQEFQFVPAPDEASVDITRTDAAFGQRRLDVTIHLRDLEARARHEVLVRVWTPDATFDVTAQRRSARRATVALARRDGDVLGCRALRVAYDGAADSVALSVPARCIGAPRWVRLGVEATATPRLDADNPGTVFYLADDGHRGSVRQSTVGKGPRVRRG